MAYGANPPIYGPVPLFGAELEFKGIDGVYTVHADQGYGFAPIDVGEAEDIGRRLRNHDRKPDWFSLMEFAPTLYQVYASPTPPEEYDPKAYRLWLEAQWRAAYRQQGYLLFGERP